MESIDWTPEKIRQLREAHEMTQGEFAELLGVRGHATISDWERGVKKPSSLASRMLSELKRKIERKTKNK